MNSNESAPTKRERWTSFVVSKRNDALEVGGFCGIAYGLDSLAGRAWAVLAVSVLAIVAANVEQRP